MADFGMAKTLAGATADTPTGGLTESGTVVGTPSYMAPEQAGGRAAEVGPAADVYALGAILYAALTGRPPFQAATLIDTLDLVRSADPVPPRRLVPGVPRDLETICLKCLRKNPAQRYETAQALADDLGRFLDGAPITARPVGWPERAAKWCRRRPAWAALIAIGVFLPAVGVAAVLGHNARLQTALAEKTAEEEKARREKERADENYRNARLALRRTLDALADKRFADLPRMTELRKTQAEAALAFFRIVADRPDDPRPDARHDAARADFETGQLYSALGQQEQAVAHLRRAVDALDRLVAAHPDRRDYRRDRGLALLNLGGQSGATAEAVAITERAVADFRGLADDPAAGYEDRSYLANGLNTLGLIHRAGGRPADAEPLLRAALDLRSALGAGREGEPTYNRLLAENMLNLGSIYRESGRTGPATELHEKCEAVLQRLMDADPTDRPAAVSLAVERVNWTYVLLNQGRQADALNRLARSLPSLERLNQLDPSDAKVRDALYRVHGVRSTVYENLGRFADAVGCWERSLSFCPPADRRVNSWLLARTRVMAGDATGAVRDVGRLLPETDAAAELTHGAETAALAAARRRAAAAACSGAAADGIAQADALTLAVLAKLKAVSPAADWGKTSLGLWFAPLYRPYHGRPAFDTLLAGK
ncbi:MAG: tetratricopeptide repeat-containing protein kinase family protein [Gemmataceae bacterium]